MEMNRWKHIHEASIYSEDQLAKVKTTLENKYSGRRDCCVVIVGSFARREASAQSDLDFFVLSESSAPDAAAYKDVLDSVSEVAIELGIRKPAVGGAFAACASGHWATSPIGGDNDSNDDFTRRILFLLESSPVFNSELYDKMFDVLIERYVNDLITQHQLCKFLLNDVIRYYRTICVDFDHKTRFCDKSWGDRSIKLMFSRKLLYFCGILAVAETAQRSARSKREVLSSLLKIPPIQRLIKICGESSTRVLDGYDHFLGNMAESRWREELSRTTDVRNDHSDDFRDFKNRGHHFSWELSRLLNDRYDVAHPIHHALKF